MCCCLGPAQGSFDDRPFVELMQSQGLEPGLQALVLHAVLLLDHAQQAQQAQQQQQQPHDAHGAAATTAGMPLGSGPAGVSPAAGAAEAAAGPAAGTADTAGAACITAAAALRLMDVHMRSVGRYGADAGPFLTPMYGCGELAQVGGAAFTICWCVACLALPAVRPLHAGSLAVVRGFQGSSQKEHRVEKHL